MSWRIEPTPRADGVEEGLAARIHDPLWLLARQWQMGEFRGQDAGTPAIVRMVGSAAPVYAWRGAGQTEWAPLDPDTTPLDALVESEAVDAPTIRQRIDAGAHFLRLLTSANLDHLREPFASAHQFPAELLASPAMGADPLLAAIAARTADGSALRSTATELAGGRPISIDIPAGDSDAARRVASEWLEWFAAEIQPPGIDTGTAVTWDPHRMEYGFSVSCGTAGGTVLRSQAYLGDGLDWYDFDIDPAATPATPPPVPVPVEVQSVPAPIRYGGMPLPRFWMMEDSRYDFGNIDAAGHDLGRLLLVEFATVFGNDWYLLPLKLPSATLTVLDHVVVTDVFGRNLVLDRTGKDDPQWNVFSLAVSGSGISPAQQGLLLPPTAAHIIEADPIETILMLRDEMADLVWAVESRVVDALGKTIDRRAKWVPERVSAPADAVRPAYRVESSVPDYWIPFAPEQLEDQQSIRLRLVPMEVDEGGVPRLIEPKGRLLASDERGERPWLFEEEVPREGTSVDRVWRMSRWQRGQSVTWRARRRRTGRGEGSSGLRFDFLDPA